MLTSPLVNEVPLLESILTITLSTPFLVLKHKALRETPKIWYVILICPPISIIEEGIVIIEDAVFSSISVFSIIIFSPLISLLFKTRVSLIYHFPSSGFKFLSSIVNCVD